MLARNRCAVMCSTDTLSFVQLIIVFEVPWPLIHNEYLNPKSHRLMIWLFSVLGSIEVGPYVSIKFFVSTAISIV